MSEEMIVAQDKGDARLIMLLREIAKGAVPLRRACGEAADRLEALLANERLNYEEIAILHGQQVTVTFKRQSDAFDLFNELRDRGSALPQETNNASHSPPVPPRSKTSAKAESRSKTSAS
jgi:hypothetical protein